MPARVRDRRRPDRRVQRTRWRAPDPQASLRRLLASTDPFDRWLAGTVAPLHPVPLATLVDTVSANRLIAQYPHAGHH
jgi:hypothetical protein